MSLGDSEASALDIRGLIIMAEIIDLAAQRELSRISRAVTVARKRTELAHVRLACLVIDDAKHDQEIASVLDELTQLRRDLELAIERWPSSTETRNVRTVS
jgi:hypothetical protein